MGDGQAAADHMEGVGVPLASSSAAPACGLAPLRWTILACAALALAAVALAPLTPAARLAFSMVCHQDPERCFFFLGVPLPLCARCVGVYAGLLAATVLPVRAPAAVLWGLAFANGLDWLLGFASNGPRCVLALAFVWLAGASLLASRKHPASH